MKSSTPELMKFKRLQRRLKESTRAVVGLLEMLWLGTAKNCPQGDIGRFTNLDIAIMCDYDGDPDELVTALVEERWLDVHDQHRLVVHDWHEHCPTHIANNLKRWGKSFANHVKENQGEKIGSREEPPKEDPKESTKEPPKDVTPNLAKPSQTEPNQLPSENADAAKAANGGEGGTSKSVRFSYADVPIPDELQDPKFVQAWQDWHRYRRERKLRSWTISTVQAKLAEFCEMGISRSIASIRYSISQGYQGIVEPKTNQNLRAAADAELDVLLGVKT